MFFKRRFLSAGSLTAYHCTKYEGAAYGFGRVWIKNKTSRQISCYKAGYVSSHVHHISLGWGTSSVFFMSSADEIHVIAWLVPAASQGTDSPKPQEKFRQLQS